MTTRRSLSALVLGLLMVLAAGACSRPSPAASAAAEPSPGLRQSLARGVNLSNWFVHRGDPNINPKRWYPDAADFASIRRLGAGHVRVGFDPDWLADGTGVPIRARLAELRAGIDQARDAGLAVVLALQATSEAKARLFAQPAARQRLLALWRALAAALKDVPRDRLMFEALNEPESEDAATSRALMIELVAAIRGGAPDHTIAVAGHHFSDVGDLVQMAPLDDRNLVYSFHFYEPHNFTHQGAGWGWPLWIKFHGWPYPSSPEAVAPVLPSQAPEAREHLSWYGEQRWNRDKLAAQLDQAADWARRHRAVLWCSEFGVYRYGALPEHRNRWLRDTRELLEARSMAWTLWDYAGHFGMVEGPQGQRQLDAALATALGLTP